MKMRMMLPPIAIAQDLDKATDPRPLPLGTRLYATAACVAACMTFFVPEEAAVEETTTLFHYTTEEGMNGILESEQLNPSLKALNPADARYGNGQYLSDIAPGSMTPAQLSRQFLGMPFQGSRFTNWVEIDVSGLNVVQGRAGVFVVPNEGPLDLAGRIVGSGGGQ
jgi:hypothetical protein